MAASSIASELLQSLEQIPYKNDIDDYGNDNFLDPEDLKRLRTNIRDRFWIDTRPFQTRRGNVIPTGVYSIFGKYNNTPPETVKTELHDWVEDRRDEYTLLLSNILSAKKWSYGTWSVNLKLKSKPADSGAMYCINRMYHRHTIVYHKHGFWSTAACNKNRPETSKISDVHLILLGELKYGEIRPIQLSNDDSTMADWDKFEQWFQKACRDNPPPTPIPPNVRQKRATASINYYDMNRGKPLQGNQTTKQRIKGREPITLSEPSAERVAAQKRIILEKQKQKPSQVTNNIPETHDDLTVIRELPPDIDDQVPLSEVKVEVKTEIKQEDDNRNTRHKYKGKDLNWLKVRYIHKDGSICNKERRLQEETIRELESQLPDLPDSLPDETATTDSTDPQTINPDPPNCRKGLRDETTNVPPIIDSVLNVETSVISETTNLKDPPMPKHKQSSHASRLSVETATSSADTSHHETHTLVNNNTDTARLPAETNPTITDTNQHEPPTYVNNNIEDKIDAAEGLLLLGTDVSSADDSQETLEIASNVDITAPQSTDKSTREDMANDDNGNNKSKTTGLHDETADSTKSPKKGVLNFRQIGIKRHQPVDSSDPSAIGSPPGSPDKGHEQHTPKKRRSTSTSSKTNTKKKRKTSIEPAQGTKPKTSKAAKPKEDSAKKRPVEHPQKATASSSLADETDDDRKYSIKRTVISGTVYYHCSYCNKKYNTLHGLNIHHEGTHPPVQCNVCNREFSTPNSLIHHSYTHYEQSFNCDQCTKSFPFKSQLETHQAVHTQAIKHRCEKCGKGFVRTAEYNIHMKGHANIRLKCPKRGCDYDTVDVRNLNSHKKSHTKVKSVFCKICGKGFVYHEQRKRHMKEHP